MNIGILSKGRIVKEFELLGDITKDYRILDNAALYIIRSADSILIDITKKTEGWSLAGSEGIVVCKGRLLDERAATYGKIAGLATIGDLAIADCDISQLSIDSIGIKTMEYGMFKKEDRRAAIGAKKEYADACTTDASIRDPVDGMSILKVNTTPLRRNVLIRNKS